MSSVLHDAIELAGYGSVVWPDSLSEQLVEGAGLQQMLSNCQYHKGTALYGPCGV